MHAFHAPVLQKSYFPSFLLLPWLRTAASLHACVTNKVYFGNLSV